MANFPDHRRGDSWAGFTLTASDDSDPENPQPIDFSDARIVFQVRSGNGRNHPLVMELNSDSGGGITVAGTTVTAAAQVVNLPPQTYYTDIAAHFEDGSILTVNQGTWTILADIATT